MERLAFAMFDGYKPTWGFPSLVAVYLWAGLSVNHVWWAWITWKKVYNSEMFNVSLDMINFYATAGLFGQNVFVLLISFWKYDQEKWRKRYFYSSFFTMLLLPMFIWPAMFFGYAIDGSRDRTLYPSFNYAAIKIILMFIYEIVMFFVAYECVAPIFAWWQILAQLADKIPYDRPSVAEVEAADVLTLSINTGFDM